MAKVTANEIYAKFLAEAKEENGNFYFVKLYDEKLYERLCRVERYAHINLSDSGTELRNALEFFAKGEVPSNRLNELYKLNAQRTRRDSSRSADLIDYQNYFKNHRELGVDADLFNSIREAGNSFHHEKRNTNRQSLPKTYETLCSGLRNMQKMLINYYTKLNPAKLRGLVIQTYSRDKQPYGDKAVCSIMNTLDSTACERQVLCSRKDDMQPNLNHYYLLRIYKANNVTEGTIRDEKVLSSLWSNSLRGIPNIVRYSPLNIEYDGEDPAKEKKYIVSYDFGSFKPCPLHVKLLETLNNNQRIMIMHDIAAGVKVLHSSGIYHRNLQPNSVFVFFDRNSDFVQAKLVGFEYAKIEGDNATVFVNVAKRQQEDPSAFFSVSMKQGLKNKQVADMLDWAKEDIYSLGVLFYFIITGKTPQGPLQVNMLGEKVDDEMKKLISDMLSPVIANRPTIDEVMRIVEPQYQRLL